MINLKNTTPKRNAAQAMVEFAIALPILLLLLYGLLETGRLLFIYSTIVTASRQAVRYGSATGQGITTTVPRYQDCAGIRAAANKADFLNAFDDSDIVIQYDSGPSTPVFDTCDGAYDPLVSPSSSNSTRLLVTIDGDFNPIVPKLVPFIARTVANGNPIKGTSARTILVSVSIVVTVPPSTWQPSTPTSTPTVASPTPTPSNTPTDTPTPTPIFTPTPTLTATFTLTPTITLTPTVTNTPTLTRTPSPSPTNVPICNNISHGSLSISGGVLSMTITNPNAYPINIQDVFVVWNHDKGHQVGTDKTLHLTSASLGSQFWSGTSSGPSTTLIPSSATVIPPGTSTIIFTFHQSYDTPDGSERIVISLSSPGCTLFPIDSAK